MKIVPFEDQHLPEAMNLFAHRYQKARERYPAMAPDHEQPDHLLSDLKELVANNPGVAALQGDRLIGFMAVYQLENFRGKSAVYCPEWGNAAQPDDAGRIYEQMYAALASGWIRNDILAHYISVLAYDQRTTETLSWLGFGRMGVDAVRPARPIDSISCDIDIRVATQQDIPGLIDLDQKLVTYSSDSPIFLRHSQVSNHDEFEVWLSEPYHRIFMAYKNAQTVGFIKLQKWNEGACKSAQDNRSLSITGAYVEDSCRGQGIGLCLLNQALTWAAVNGFERCAVDFESYNPLAVRFWLRFFQPVCYSLVRHVDPSPP